MIATLLTMCWLVGILLIPTLFAQAPEQYRWTGAVAMLSHTFTCVIVGMILDPDFEYEEDDDE